MAAARKLGAQASIEKPVLLHFKELKGTSTRWKEEAQTAVDVHEESEVVRTTSPDKVRSFLQFSSLVIDAWRKFNLSNQGDASTERPRDDAQESTLNSKPDELEVVQHDHPCDRCAGAGVACRGIPGRACERCKSVSQRCTKSNGRGGVKVKRKRDADGDAEQEPEGTCTVLYFIINLLTAV